MDKIDTENKLLLTITEAKQLLNCGRDQIYHLMENGSLDDRRVGHRRKITRESLYDYLINLPKYKDDQNVDCI